MTYIMSLDVGDKRIGVAIGTLNPKSLAPYAIYERAKGQAENQIISLILIIFKYRLFTGIIKYSKRDNSSWVEISSFHFITKKFNKIFCY